MYQESDYLMLSALQHIVFCERQCALIHIEQQWAENVLTTKGNLMHEKVHSEINEHRNNTAYLRGLKISSKRLGLNGQTDMVEVTGSENNKRYFPVEYKHGKPKKDHSDLVQLCAQALCLEEMYDCKIEEGALFYGKERRRLTVQFTAELKAETEKLCIRLHELIDSGVNPSAVYSKKCESCSLLNICMPKISDNKVSNYIRELYSIDENAS